MDSRDFGTKLRELRQQASLSQRDLADIAGINFTYLSKIESGAMPPPSEKVLVKLAEVLNIDTDELLILAGKIPSDIAQILKDPEALQSLRAIQNRQKDKSRDSGIKGGFMKNLFAYKKLAKAAATFFLVFAVAASLWFAAPTQALTIDITNPSTGTLGNTYSFDVAITIETGELLPVENINLKIYNVDDAATYYDLYSNLATNTTGFTLYTTSGTGSNAQIRAVADSNWNYFQGTKNVNWQGGGYTFTPPTGYGYGYYLGTADASITYSVIWTIPSGWAAGNYKIETKITAPDAQTFTQLSSQFVISASSVVDDSGPPAAPAPPAEPGVNDVSDIVDDDGVFIEETTSVSTDNIAQVTIPANTVGLTAEGTPLTEITIVESTETPTSTADAVITDLAGATIALMADSTFVGNHYTFGPEGATFDPPVTISLTFSLDDIPEGFSTENLAIARLDPETGNWVIMEGITVDPVTLTVSASVDHFSDYVIVATLKPAAFTASDLQITPAEVETGESVTLSIKVENTGNLEGTYTVTLKINDQTTESKEVTIAGGTSQKVSFSTVQDAAGTYSVSINNQTGTFTVVTPEVEVPVKPADISVSNLVITPAIVNTGDTVTVSVTVANTGDLSGSYTVTLEVNGVTIDSKDVTVAGGASQKVSFTSTQDTADTYSVSVNDLTGSFTVQAPVEPATQVNWGLIIGIIAAVVVIGAVIWIMIRRRR